MDEIARLGQYWSVTITPYGRDIEPHVPDKTKVIASFHRISTIVGARAMSWRYDPIFISNKYNVDFHIHSFEAIAAQLSLF